MSSKQPKIKFGSYRNKPKQDLFRVCFGLFCETKNKKFRFVSVFQTYIETTKTNRTVLLQTETTLNFLKNSPKYSLSNCLVGSSVCFGSIETSKLSVSVTNRNKLFRNKPKKTKKTRKTLNFLKKLAKYAPYQTVSVGLLFVLVQSKHRNSLFRYRSETTETNVPFRIVPKLVSVPVLFILNRN